MGWSIGFDDNLERDIGYGVPAYCDHPGCYEEIDRGLAYVCGGEPYGGEHGCGLHFCKKHRQLSGKRRGFVSLCRRCYHGRQRFDLKQDHPDWMRRKLHDESWSQWRDENKESVQEMIEYLSAKEPQCQS